MGANLPFASSKGQILFILNRMPVIFVSILLLSLALLFVNIERIKREGIQTQLIINEFAIAYDISKLCDFNFSSKVYFEGSIWCNKDGVCEYKDATFYGYPGYYKGCVEFYKDGARKC